MRIIYLIFLIFQFPTTFFLFFFVIWRYSQCYRDHLIIFYFLEIIKICRAWFDRPNRLAANRKLSHRTLSVWLKTCHLWTKKKSIIICSVCICLFVCLFSCEMMICIFNQELCMTHQYIGFIECARSLLVHVFVVWIEISKKKESCNRYSMANHTYLKRKTTNSPLLLAVFMKIDANLKNVIVFLLCSIIFTFLKFVLKNEKTCVEERRKSC